MNDTLQTLFLAQALGLYLLITSVILIARADYYRDLLSRVHVGSPTLVISGVVGLICGILIVLVHNIWVSHSEVLVTIVGWVILIKSILWLAFPGAMVRYTLSVTASAWKYYIGAIIAAIVGIILVAHGFYPFHAFQHNFLH